MTRAKRVIKAPRTRKAILRPPRAQRMAVRFIESMECLGVKRLPEAPEWSYEIKLDGFRLEVVKTKSATTLFSRRGNILNAKFPYIATALAKLPAQTIIDGEIIALGQDGRSDFNLLQNFRSAEAKIHYYAFDVLVLKGKSLLQTPLDERRAILNEILPRNAHVATSPVERGTSKRILEFVKSYGLEGIVAKKSGSFYEPGKRSGLWCKHRLNEGQEFVIGGYTPGTMGLDSIIIGFHEGKDLMFAARVRAGFVPATRREVFAKIRPLQIGKCPFANLPETSPGRFGQGLTAQKMKECFWVRPEVVVRVDFAEWTGANKLRHTQFIALRDDKDPRKVVRETN
jgi:DNA ligase D-like protein (predicted ligase)